MFNSFFEPVDPSGTWAEILRGHLLSIGHCRVCACMFSCVWLFVTQGSEAHRAPLSIGFSRQEYWCGLLFSSSGDLPDPGIKLASSALRVDSLLLSHLGSPDTGKLNAAVGMVFIRSGHGTGAMCLSIVYLLCTVFLDRLSSCWDVCKEEGIPLLVWSHLLIPRFTGICLSQRLSLLHLSCSY